MSEFQKTIKEPVTLSGKGLHTGLEVELTYKPAPPNTGFVFRRVDLEGQPELPALAEYVVDTSRGTVIENNGCRIGTIEHSLAALRGMDVDNCIIELNAPEAPILDGSSKFFVEAIEKAGVEEQNETRVYYEISEPLKFSDEEKGIEIIALPDDKFSINTLISYPSEFLNNQYATLNSLAEFKDEIASSRTFVFLRELEFLQKNNLIKGGDLSNAIVIVDHDVQQRELDKLADLLHKPSVKIEKQGILNNVALNFDNEMARHKLLDIVGDLSLVGMPIKGRIIATRPGHWANTEFAKIIRKSIKKELSKSPAPSYNPNDVPVFDTNQIKDLLPHRPPFLMVDKIISIEGKTIAGVKNVTINEDFFRGHFPQEPVMPGVLLVEAMAQVGGILVLHKFEDPEKYSTYFLRIDNIKFRKKVVPGDTVIFKLALVSDIRRGIANMRGEAFVGNSIVAEGEFMAQVIKNK